MVESLHARDRVPVVAAFASPLVGLPLLGPWVLNASVAEDSPAKPHIARAFDLHLFSALITVVLWFVAVVFTDFATAELVSGGFLMVAVIASGVLLVGILRCARWSAPWQPVVLGDRKFYHQAPFVG